MISQSISPSKLSTNLSNDIILSDNNTFYGYSFDFTKTNPLYCLLSCKANKGRPVSEINNLLDQINLLFVFGETCKVCSVETAKKLMLIHNFSKNKSFGKTYLGKAHLSEEQFYELRAKKDGLLLSSECMKSFNDNLLSGDRFIDIFPSQVISVMTTGGNLGTKYLLFNVTETSSEIIKVDACHILLNK